MTKMVAKKIVLKDRILTRALEMFNEKGIEYVGMRELAASLDVKLGNITYYFPTKEELIYQLAVDLSESNSAILRVDESLSITEYLEMTRRHFENQYRYKCLFTSFVHLMTQYGKLSERYRSVETNRREMSRKNLEYLVVNGYLRNLTAREFDTLCANIILLSRFWLSEATITYNHLTPSEQIGYYLNVLANTLGCYSTEKGKIQVEAMLLGY